MRKIIKLILVIIWMVLIFCFSNQKAEDSSKLSNGVIVKVASVFLDDSLNETKKDELIEDYTTIVRKTAHFAIYLVLGVLIISFISEFSINHVYLIALFLSLLYACSDEFHQTFISGRSGEVKDVLIDTLGALLGIILYRFIKRFKEDELK